MFNQKETTVYKEKQICLFGHAPGGVYKNNNSNNNNNNKQTKKQKN